MGKKRTTYTAVYERDMEEKNPDKRKWLVSIPTVPSCFTDGLTLAAARRHIREVLELCVGDEGRHAEIVDDIRLGELAKPVSKTIAARAAADEAVRLAQTDVRVAVRSLEKAGVSQRDAAEILGVSFQRIGALSRSPAPRRAFSSLRGKARKSSG